MVEVHLLQELSCRWNQSRWFMLCNMHFLLLHSYQYSECVLQLKRTNVGIALVANPRVLFLDEPTSGKHFAAGCADAALSCRCASAINIKHAVFRWPCRCSNILHKDCVMLTCNHNMFQLFCGTLPNKHVIVMHMSSLVAFVARLS